MAIVLLFALNFEFCTSVITELICIKLVVKRYDKIERYSDI